MGQWTAACPRLPRVELRHSPSLSPQSSQPSTTSPFKQEVFVYSPSPSSESPSLGAAATPVIMSRSPTGQWRPAGGAHRAPSGGGAAAWPSLLGHMPQARGTGLFLFQPRSVRASSAASSPHRFITLQRPVFSSPPYSWGN